MAASPESLPGLLSTLAGSLEAAAKALPTSETDLPQQQNGVSLLHVKSELFISYLQNLAFLILLKLKNNVNTQNGSNERDHSGRTVQSEAVQKLVELRVYLEKGIRPLETRLKYQLDKVVRAADTAERDDARRSAKHSKPIEKGNGVGGIADENSSNDSDAEEGHSDSDASSSGSMDDLSHRPNLGAFANSAKQAGTPRPGESSKNNEIYRPPRIMPTALPTTTNLDDRARRARKPLRSRAIDEYISNEVSTAPIAEPSIGSTIAAGGRTTKSSRELKDEAQRTAYEEANFVRLPPMSKKEKAKRSGKRESGFGGEELRGLGEGLDRIGQSTKKRREGRPTEDGPRGEGFDGLGHISKKRRSGRR